LFALFKPLMNNCCLCVFFGWIVARRQDFDRHLLFTFTHRIYEVEFYKPASSDMQQIRVLWKTANQDADAGVDLNRPLLGLAVPARRWPAGGLSCPPVQPASAEPALERQECTEAEHGASAEPFVTYDEWPVVQRWMQVGDWQPAAPCAHSEEDPWVQAFGQLSNRCS
jgi:hypothetical protein